MRNLCLTGLLTACFCSPTFAQPADVVVNAGNRAAFLGSAYKSDKETFVGFGCGQGTGEPSGGSTSSFALDQAISESALSNELGFSIGARARYGVIDGSLAADFLSRSMASSYSVSSIYKATYFLPVEKLGSVELSPIGGSVKNAPLRWAASCGDRFVSEITRGAKLFVSVRIDFSSQQKKEEFSSKFSISGPLASANADLKKASTSIDKNAKVTISAFQYGGDVTKVTQIFAKSDESRAAYIECGLGSFDKCAALLTAILDYAGNTTTGFPSQLTTTAKPGPADLSYSVVSYEAAGIFMEYRALEKSVQSVRENLAEIFEKNFQTLTVSKRLLSGRLHPSRRGRIEQTRASAQENVDNIRGAATFCYENPNEDCLERAKNLRLAAVPAGSLALDSFEVLCIDSLLLPRSDPLKRSIAYLGGIAEEKKDIGIAVRDAEHCHQLREKLAARNSMDVSGLLRENFGIVSEFTQLRWLLANQNEIDDLSVIRDMRDLEILELNNNKVSDLSPLSGLSKLADVQLKNNNIGDLAGLANNNSVIRLLLSKNNISDISILSTLPRLTTLDLSGNLVKSLQALHQSERLSYLDIRGNPIPYRDAEAFAAANAGVKFALDDKTFGTFKEYAVKHYGVTR